MIIKNQENKDLLAEYNKIENIKEKLKNCLWNNVGHLVFIYTDKSNKITQIKLRKPFDKKFSILKFDPFITGVFNHTLLLEELTSDPIFANREIITEGEFNTLQLQSLMIKNGEGYVKSCAVGGVSTADFKTLKAIVKDPVINYDNDKSGAGLNLPKNAQRHFFFDAFTTPEIDSDLDSFIRGYGEDHKKALEAVKQLIVNAERHEIDFKSVKASYLAIQESSEMSNIQKKLAATELIINELHARCLFYKDNNYNYIYIKKNKKVVEISKDCDELKLMLAQMGINASERIFKYLFEEIITECTLYGKKVNLHDFAYYDRDQFALYIYNCENKIFKITKDSIKTIINGEDNVLFKYRPNNQPFNLVDIDKNIDYLEENIIQKVNLDSDEGYLTKEDQKIILRYWLLGLFFESIMYTKTILVTIGEKGSGKTFTLKSIGKLLFGDNYNVTPLPSKQEDFDTVITNSYYCVLDNVDSFTPWLNDKLACVATGQTVKKRILYTDNKMAEIETKCFLAMTSRTPNFTRDDVADRLICLYIKRFEDFKSENDLLQELLKHRDQIMSYIILELQKVIAALYVTKDKKFQTKFRIADFAIFCQRIDEQQGNKDNIAGIFDKIIQNQLTFAIENDSLVHTLKIWISQDNEGRELDARTLFLELNETAKKYNISDFNYKNAMSLCRRLAHITQNIKDEIEITKLKSRANKSLYKFKLLCEVEKLKSSTDGIF